MECGSSLTTVALRHAEVFRPHARPGQVGGISQGGGGFRMTKGYNGKCWGARGGDRGREFEVVALVHLDALYRSALRLTHNRPAAPDPFREPGALLRQLLGRLACEHGYMKESE
jgi:hypothetical protein